MQTADISDAIYLYMLDMYIQVRIFQENGEHVGKSSFQVLSIDKLRMKLSKGRAVRAKEEYSSFMQVCILPTVVNTSPGVRTIKRFHVFVFVSVGPNVGCLSFDWACNRLMWMLSEILRGVPTFP